MSCARLWTPHGHKSVTQMRWSGAYDMANWDGHFKILGVPNADDMHFFCFSKP